MVGYELKVVGNSQRAIYRVHGLLNSLKIRMEYAREPPRETDKSTEILAKPPIGVGHKSEMAFTHGVRKIVVTTGVLIVTYDNLSPDWSALADVAVIGIAGELPVEQKGDVWAGLDTDFAHVKSGGHGDRNHPFVDLCDHIAGENALEGILSLTELHKVILHLGVGPHPFILNLHKNLNAPRRRDTAMRTCAYDNIRPRVITIKAAY